MKKFNIPSFTNKIKLKRGTYSAIIIALVLVGIIAFNVLISIVSDRFKLEYDMTADKINTISDENIEYIESVENEVSVKICATENQYLQYMSSLIATEYEQQGVYFDTTADYSSYYAQMFSLVEKYNDYNDNIVVEFLDTQDASFSEIQSKYANENIAFGDIIVSCTINENERYKIVGYKDIYDIATDDSMAMYGYTTAAIEGNNIETALTSAIAYVTNENDTKVAFITGHSAEDISANYRELLETNNYKVDVISDKIITKISSEYDAIFIIGPTKDFLEDELNVIATFLDNGEKYDKGLVFVASANSPYLPNIYGFLEEWGIEIEEGLLFDTGDYHLSDMPTAMGSFPNTATEDDILNGMSVCITSGNIPMNQAFEVNGDKTTSCLFATANTVVNAPVGTKDSWQGFDTDDAKAYATVIHSQRSTYNSNNDLIKNNVIVFSSTDFVYSDFTEYEDTSNKNIAFAAAERAVGAEDTGISFVTKVITDQSFATSVTESSANNVLIIFVIALPLLIIGVCIFVCVWRRRS